MDPITAVVLSLGVLCLVAAPLLAFRLAWRHFGRVLDRDAYLYGKLLDEGEEHLFGDAECLCEDCRREAGEGGEEDD